MNLIVALKILPVLVTLWVTNWVTSCQMSFNSREELVSPSLPSIDQKTIKGRKVRVGFIDQGTPFWNHEYLSKFSHKDVNFEWKKRDHSTAVISSFLLQLESELPNAKDLVEIVVCSAEKADLEGSIRCLQLMHTEKLDYLNISLSGFDFSDHEKVLLELISKNTVITFAAGNNGLTKPSYPCAYNVSNTVCVGNVNYYGIINYSSNFGSWVNTYDLGVDVRVFDSDLSAPTARTGTSFSAPIHMARLVAGSIRGDRFDYMAAMDKFNKDNQIVKIQHASN